MAENNLVSVTSETEHNLTEGKSETKIYLKMYVAAVKEGLIADLGDSNWRTLCVVASFMNEKGECYPTQAQIAKGLGVSRQAAQRRLSALAEYRWNGKPLISTVKGRSSKGTFENTRYTIHPISQLRIFEAEPEELSDK